MENELFLKIIKILMLLILLITFFIIGINMSKKTEALMHNMYDPNKLISSMAIFDNIGVKRWQKEVDLL